jgi:hypothetical protein
VHAHPGSPQPFTNGLSSHLQRFQSSENPTFLLRFSLNIIFIFGDPGRHSHDAQKDLFSLLSFFLLLTIPHGPVLFLFFRHEDIFTFLFALQFFLSRFGREITLEV